MNAPIDNIAGRLYNLVVEIKQKQGNNPYTVFAEVFKIDPNDKASILQIYAELFNMATEGKKKIQQININKHDKYLKSLDNVIEGLSKIDLNDSLRGMMHFKNYFNNDVLIPLEYCAEFLSNYSIEKIVNDEEINFLLEEIDELIKQIFEMEIEKDLKNICIYSLENIRESIINYKLFGNDGLIKNMESSLGSLMLNKYKAKSDSDKNLFNKIYNVINKINMILTSGNKSIDLIETFTDNIDQIC